MGKRVLEISGYTVLPIRLPPLPSFPISATHYIYLHSHEPRIPSADASRSLFLVNIPIDTTEAHLKHLFSVQLSAGRVERVEFESTLHTKKRDTKFPDTTTALAAQSKKRKRVTADDLEKEMAKISLPSTWDRDIHKSGGHAVVVFVDKPSMEASLKAAKKAAKSGMTITWGEGVEDRIPPLGVERYRNHEKLRYPPKSEVMGIVNEYMSLFTQAEEERAREQARKAQMPDEDGFITVTKGPKINSVAREEEVKQLVEKQKKREEGLGDFYRFQNREKRKEKQNELRRKFEEDKKALEEMKKRRDRLRAE